MPFQFVFQFRFQDDDGHQDMGHLAFVNDFVNHHRRGAEPGSNRLLARFGLFFVGQIIVIETDSKKFMERLPAGCWFGDDRQNVF